MLCFYLMVTSCAFLIHFIFNFKYTYKSTEYFFFNRNGFKHKFDVFLRWWVYVLKHFLNLVAFSYFTVSVIEMLTPKGSANVWCIG